MTPTNSFPKSSHQSSLSKTPLPLISIVLPTYNGARYLAESIESCLAQTYYNFELIVIDDHSTDSTPKIIDQYARQDARVRSFRNSTNLKLPNSLNRGFQLARGTYHTWTSDDNRYLPDALATMAEAIEKNTSDIVYAPMYSMDDQGNRGSPMRIREPESLIDGNDIGACFLMRSEVFKKLSGYDAGYFLVEDYDFWLRASRFFRFHQIRSEPLYEYREHGASLTQTRANRTTLVACQALERNLETLPWATPDLRARGWLRIAVQRTKTERNLLRFFTYGLKAFRAAPKYFFPVMLDKIRHKNSRPAERSNNSAGTL